MFKPILGLACILLSLGSVVHAKDAAPKTPAPVIYLRDNAGEPQDLGWCLDTRGRGFSETAQVHSCKPQGGDVQFAFDPVSGLLSSVVYPEFCLQIGGSLETPTFDLVTCDGTAPGQIYGYSETEMTFHPGKDANTCLAALETVTSAGPFHSRALAVGVCEETPAALKQWVVVTK